ncbi:winged helix-turn-helix domain-containing tetratricopeptide repeat protein [Ruegeria marina]|uniref:Tetratricopeptide repeat-containing protein n=1 Tax=Ruegeria marina TaxID=639004 RepID=A0A1G6Z909_9RHOB|nr:winged helix-turn-helix domain-containing protein [Ruegeria marina]SDD98952.1 Tetratricopeptide repeat-containing protein [Ruegeria marina]
MVDPGIGRSADGFTTARDAIRAQLRPHSAAVLDHLLAHHGTVVSKHDLMDAVWPDVEVTENSLYQCIADIRKAIGPESGLTLSNVPGRGYVLERIAAGHGTVMKWPWIAGGAVLLAGTVMIGAFFPAEDKRSTGQDLAVAGYVAGDVPAATARADHAAAEAPGVSVAMFDNLSQDPRWDTLGQSLAAEISGQLAANKWLQVFTDAQSDAARFRLSGTVHPREGEVHIGARLTERDSGRLVWSRSWTGAEAEFFALQAAVAHEAAAELSGHWSGAVVRFDATRAGRQPTHSLDAYELFLRGTQAKHRFTPDGFEEARHLLGRAVEIDPGFVDAWATLSVVHNLRALIQTDIAALEDVLAERVAAVETAVALAPAHPIVLMEQGWLQARRGDHTASRQSVQRAAALAPDNPDVLAYAALNGNLRVDLGEEGIGWVSRARSLNPDPPSWYAIGDGLAHFSARDWEGTVAAFEVAPDYVTRHLFTAVALEQLGRETEARAVVERMMTALPGFRVDYFIYQEGMDMEVNGRLILETARALGVPVAGDVSLERASAAGRPDQTR